MIVFILDLKIPFDCLSSHRPFKFICLPPATDPAWYQRGINVAGCPPLSANEAVSFVPLVRALFGHFVISILPQHLQHPDSNLGQFKIL